MGWPGYHVIAKLIFVGFNKHAEIPANSNQPGSCNQAITQKQFKKKSRRIDVRSYTTFGMITNYRKKVLCKRVFNKREDKCVRVTENDTKRHYSVRPSLQ